MGNSYSIYRLSYHICRDSTILLINHQKNIIQHFHEYAGNALIIGITSLFPVSQVL